MKKSSPDDFLESPETAISKETIVTIVKGLAEYPEGFQPLKKGSKNVRQPSY
jgi:2-oxoglutarate dehydrogenase E1 component